LKNITNEVGYLSDNVDIQNILREYDNRDDEKTKELTSKAGNAINDFFLKENKEISYVQIISNKYGSSLNLRVFTAYETNYDYDELDKILSGRDSMWLDNIDNKFFNSSWLPKAIYLKRIHNSADKVDTGIIIIHLRDTLCEDFMSDMNINLHIISSVNSIVYQSGDIKVDESFYKNNNLFTKNNGSFQKNINGSNCLVNYITSEYTGWKIVSYIVMDDILKVIENIRNVIIFVGFICFFCSVMFSLFVSYRIATPINNIRKYIEDIENGRFHPDQYIGISRNLFNRIIGKKYSVPAIYILITIIPVIITILTINGVTSKSIKNQSIQYYQHKIELVSQKVDINLLNYNHIVEYLFGNTYLNDLLIQQKCGKMDKKEFNENVDKFVSNIDSIASGELGLTILDNNKESIYLTDYIQHNLKNQLSPIDNNLSNTTIWLPTVYDCGVNLVNFGKRLVSFQNYEDISFYDNLGYIISTVNEQFIERMYRSMITDINYNIYIIDDTGKVISHADKSNIRNFINKDYISNMDISTKNGHFIIKKAKEDLLVTYSKLNTNNWTVISEVPERLLFTDIRTINYYSVILVLFIIVIIALVVMTFINRMITSQLNKLNYAMKKLSGGDMSVQVDINTGDEIQRLANGFNSMVRKLKELMEENYMNGLRRKEAELNALQAQINPHFLYNTLESINWEAMMLSGGSNKVSEMVTALSDLLRLSINKGREIVTFEDEFNHLRSYIIIQKERYSDKFDIEWDVDEELYEYRTLKLILQPLVENSIYHGIELKSEKGLIIIRGKLLEDQIKLEITDNGLGMNFEQLDAVRKSLSDLNNRPDNRGIGLKNVNDRIQLYFGKNYGLKIFSEEGSGTLIEIYLPKYIDENMNPYAQGGC
jgi:Predicted signal transduction protein with a C-terminal ATPase domain